MLKVILLRFLQIAPILATSVVTIALPAQEACVQQGVVNLYILRHGETWANRAQIAQGALNDYRATLTLDGMLVADKEARVFADYLKQNGITIDSLLISPTLRTNQTAQVFLQYFNPVTINRAAKAFGPQPWGELDGKPLNTVVTLEGDKAVDYVYINRDWKPLPCAEFPESESVNETTRRVLLGLSDLYLKANATDPSKKHSVVVITHSDAIKPLLEYITGTLPIGRIPNCRVHHMTISGVDDASGMPNLVFHRTIE